MKIAQARNLLTKDIGKMTLEQLQWHRVRLLDAWRESKAEYGWTRAVQNGFYSPIRDTVSGYVPRDPWLNYNLSRRIDEVVDRELELLIEKNRKA